MQQNNYSNYCSLMLTELWLVLFCCIISELFQFNFYFRLNQRLGTKRLKFELALNAQLINHSEYTFRYEYHFIFDFYCASWSYFASNTACEARRYKSKMHISDILIHCESSLLGKLLMAQQLLELLKDTVVKCTRRFIKI